MTKLLFTALVKAQSELKNPTKNKDVPTKAFKFSYADLEEVISVIKPALNKNGLFFIQTVREQKLVTVLGHESGEYVESAIEIPKCDDAKQLGSWLTYLRRYSLQMICGISAEDDNDCEFNGKTIAKQVNAPLIQSQPAEMMGLLTKAKYVELITLLKNRNWFDGSKTDNRVKEYIKLRFNKDSVTLLNPPELLELTEIVNTRAYDDAMFRLNTELMDVK